MATKKTKATPKVSNKKSKVAVCPDCTGGLKDANTLCPTCEGTGQVK